MTAQEKPDRTLNSEERDIIDLVEGDATERLVDTLFEDDSPILRAPIHARLVTVLLVGIMVVGAAAGIGASGTYHLKTMGEVNRENARLGGDVVTLKAEVARLQQELADLHDRSENSAIFYQEVNAGYTRMAARCTFFRGRYDVCRMLLEQNDIPFDLTDDPPEDLGMPTRSPK